MIKQLITDVAFENITLSQALTRSKIVAAILDNKIFTTWLKNEIEGYDDVELPSYRKIYAPTKLVAEFPHHRSEIIDVNLPEYLGERSIDIANHHKVYDPIPVLEENIETIKESEWQIALTYNQVEVFNVIYLDNVKQYGGIIRKGYRVCSRTSFTNIIDLTKQKLLEILMNLDKEFPNLENNYVNNKKNDDAVKSIVNNYINAPNNNINNAIGENSSITSHYTNNLSHSQEKSLTDLGVENKDIQELKLILMESNKENPPFAKKLMVWSASVASSLAGRGLYDAIPKISEFVTQLM